MEADLLSVYGIDVLDIGSPRVSWRRVASLIARLPPDSRVALEVHGERARWQATEYLLAHIVDVLNVANWQRAGDKKAKRPKPVPRPGEIEQRSRRRTGLTQDQIKARLRAQLARRAREAGGYGR